MNSEWNKPTKLQQMLHHVPKPSKLTANIRVSWQSIVVAPHILNINTSILKTHSIGLFCHKFLKSSNCNIMFSRKISVKI